MTTNTNNRSALPDDVGEQISAYLDGETTPQEAAMVERLLAEDPAARRFADELRAVSRVCHEAPTPAFGRDLSSSVVAEALQRQAAGEGQVELADRLEPEGEFGLPFGKASRSWMWAGVAAAAAIMIIANRPEPPKARGTVAAIQQAMPNVQVVNLQASRDALARLQQRLVQQRPQLPAGLMTVAGDATTPSDEQLLYVEADDPSDLDRLLADFNEQEGGLVTVDRPESEPTAPTAAPAKASVPAGIRAVPLRLKLSQADVAKLIAHQKQAQANAAQGQRRFVVLRIKVKQ
ncbi:MAG: hypothetical protein AAF266_09640 [Planctomycetota bacterium]